MEVSADAGKLSKPSMLVNIPKLITAYFEEVPAQQALYHRAFCNQAAREGK